MIYITGDIHREQDIHKINPREFIVGETLTEEDYVIICGDFGCIWDGSTGDNFWLKWLDSLPWNTLFIDGNHENFDVLNTYPVEEYKGGKVHRIRSKIFHLRRGEVFDIDGYKNIDKKSDTLVVYFSRMNYTKYIAYTIANKMHADVYEIKSKEKVDGTIGFWSCGRFGMLKKSMDIEDIDVDIEKYKKIIICTQNTLKS